MTLHVNFYLDGDKIAQIFAYQLITFGEEPPTSRRQAREMLREHLKFRGYGGCDDGKDATAEQMHKCYTAAARLFPEFGLQPGPPEVCECGHWTDAHGNYDEARACLVDDCGCGAYRMKP